MEYRITTPPITRVRITQSLRYRNGGAGLVVENLNRIPMADEAQILSVTVKGGVPANGSPLNGSPNMSWRLAKKALIQTSGLAADGESATSPGSLEGADPELCITLVERGLRLKARLKAADQTWIEQFITIGGIYTGAL